MYGKFVSAMYLLNILFQSLFNLAIPILLMLGLSWLLVTKCGAPEWLYAILGVVGALVGMMSMIKFIIGAGASLERLEKERAERAAAKKGNQKTDDGESYGK